MYSVFFNIFFIGLMGTGKTTIGKIISEKLNMSFFDSDHEIESYIGLNISLIFKLKGEFFFRNIEEKIIRNIVKRKSIVLSTGGGSILSHKNRYILRRYGIVFYLRSNPYYLWIRTKCDKTRPLLQTKDSRKRLEILYKVRDPIYCKCAHFVIETDSISVNYIVDIILKKLKIICIF